MNHTVNSRKTRLVLSAFASFLCQIVALFVATDILWAQNASGNIESNAVRPGQLGSATSQGMPTVISRRYFTLSDLSWTYQAPKPPRQLKLHDLVVVVVDEKTQLVSSGEFDRRKRAESSWSLKDWIVLDGWAIRPDPQSEGDPTIGGEMEQRFRAEGEVQAQASLKFRIACEVVDIRPNGTLLLEGRRLIRNNNEMWEFYLSGQVRPEDVLPDNTVLSENIANLRIYKREVGHVRDSYRRGWLGRFIDHYQPF